MSQKQKASRPSDPQPGNTQKDPAAWKTGDEPMTGAQRSYLKTLADEAGETFDESLTKAQASERIDALRKGGTVDARRADGDDASNTRKDPHDWKTGDEPMTGAQRSYLQTLSEEAHQPLKADLTKAEASEQIEALKQKNPRTKED